MIFTIKDVKFFSGTFSAALSVLGIMRLDFDFGTNYYSVILRSQNYFPVTQDTSSTLTDK
ncbi:hypothetical protein SAMN04489723_11059 [Algoriphagus aquimarinus]|uniref:Uncharacterized protein n=1 Tax=Algoriphagus aquimarinus TaxID=237018 RepID=A0A1I1B0C6_9BACT|nr:hypothetical protein SAMN04489723_11059 [Algoriphagus aquimarinus]